MHMTLRNLFDVNLLTNINIGKWNIYISREGFWQRGSVCPSTQQIPTKFTVRDVMTHRVIEQGITLQSVLVSIVLISLQCVIQAVIPLLCSCKQGLEKAHFLHLSQSVRMFTLALLSQACLIVSTCPAGGKCSNTCTENTFSSTSGLLTSFVVIAHNHHESQSLKTKEEEEAFTGLSFASWKTQP